MRAIHCIHLLPLGAPFYHTLNIWLHQQSIIIWTRNAISYIYLFFPSLFNPSWMVDFIAPEMGVGVSSCLPLLFILFTYLSPMFTIIIPRGIKKNFEKKYCFYSFRKSILLLFCFRREKSLRSRRRKRLR